jgi:hypothetical protein
MLIQTRLIGNLRIAARAWDRAAGIVSGSVRPWERNFSRRQSGRMVSMRITRTFGVAAGLILIVSDATLEWNCSKAEAAIAPLGPFVCFRSPCQSWIDELPLHSDSNSEGEFPSTVVTYSASGSNTNTTTHINSFSYIPDVAIQPAIQAKEPAAKAPAGTVKANSARQPFYRNDFFGSPQNYKDRSIAAASNRLAAASVFRQRRFVPHRRGSI